jgi:hypothetical protein
MKKEEKESLEKKISDDLKKEESTEKKESSKEDNPAQKDEVKEEIIEIEVKDPEVKELEPEEPIKELDDLGTINDFNGEGRTYSPSEDLQASPTSSLYDAGSPGDIYGTGASGTNYSGTNEPGTSYTGTQGNVYSAPGPGNEKTERAGEIKGLSHTRLDGPRTLKRDKNNTSYDTAKQY